MSIYNLCFFAGVKATGVATGTAVAIGSGPVWTGILQWLIWRRAPRLIWWIGTALAIAGVSLILTGSDASTMIDPRGLMFCLTAGMAYATYTIVSKKVVGIVTPEVATFTIFTIAAVIAVPLATVVAASFSATSSTWLMVGYLGLLATGVAFLLFNYALRNVTAPTAVTLSLAEPLTAFLLAIVIVGETPTFLAYVGLGIVLAGLLIVVFTDAESLEHRQGSQ